MQSLETIMTSWIESYMQDVYTCMPAIVLNVKDMGEMRVDVQPVINHLFKDGTLLEYPPIGNVPLIFPSTRNSAITMPVVQGDTVMLMFSQKDMSIFKAGADRPHDPNTRRWMNLNDAVAIVGVHPFSKSPNRNAARKLPHNTDDLVVAHNIGTDRECEVRLTKGGAVSGTSTTEITLNAPVVRIGGSLVVSGTPTFSSGATFSGDVVMAGSRLIQTFDEISTTAATLKQTGANFEQNFASSEIKGAVQSIDIANISVKSSLSLDGALIVNKSNYTTHIHPFIAAGVIGISSPPLSEE